MISFIILPLPENCDHLSDFTPQISKQQNKPKLRLNQPISKVLPFTSTSKLSYKQVHPQYVCALFQGLSNKYAQGFKCVKCAKGCETCIDGSPCILALNWVQRSIVLGFSCFIMAFIPMLVWFTFRYSRVKVSLPF